MAQPTHTSTGVPPASEHGGAFPPFESSTFLSQLIWLAITFGALYYLMSRIALPRVAGLMESRAARISGDLQEAQRLRVESETAAQAYEASLAEARNKAKAIAQETRDRLAAETDARRKTLEAELAEKLAASDAAIRDTTARAMANVRGIAAETAAAIVERLTGQAPDPAQLDRAVDRALTR